MLRKLLVAIAVNTLMASLTVTTASAGTTKPNCGLIQGPNPAWQADICTYLTHDTYEHAWQGNTKMSGTRNGTRAILQIVSTALYTDGKIVWNSSGTSRNVPPKGIIFNNTVFYLCSGKHTFEAKSNYKVFWPNGDVTNRLQSSGKVTAEC